MHSRRAFLASSVSATAALAGCLDGLDSGDSDPSDSNEVTQSTDGNEQPGPGVDASNGGEDEEGETCHFEDRTRMESVLSKTRTVSGGYEWTHGYRVESGDLVTFDISASDGQDVQVEIDSPSGSTIHRETGFSVTTQEHMASGGEGEIRVLNMGDRTREEREELWADLREVSAGSAIVLKTTYQEGDSIDYRARLVDGARPKIRIEDADGNEVRNHAVSEVIDDEFRIPEDGEYFIYIENTARITSAAWDYKVELVKEIPVDSRVTLSVDREYDEQIEVCN